MKTFDQLTSEEQGLAVQQALNALLQLICDSSIRFNDALNGDNLQAHIDKALKRAEEMQTPWFAAEYLMDDPIIVENLRGMAQCDAEDTLYLESGEVARQLPTAITT